MADSGEPQEVPPEPSKSVGELKQGVEVAREELAATVEELSDRVDPRPKIEETKERVIEAGDTARSYAPIAGGVFAVLLILLIWRRRSKAGTSSSSRLPWRR